MTLPPSRERLLQRARQLVHGLRHRSVRAVAIGRFDAQDVGMVDDLRIAQHGPQRLAEIAAEDDPAHGAARRHVDLDEGRTEDVPGVAEAAADPLVRLEALLVVDRAQVRKAEPRLLHRVQRSHVPAAPGVPRAIVAVGPLRLLLLDVGGIEQHHAEQVHRRPRRIDRPFVTERHEPRQQAGMVEMCMRQQHEVDRVQVEIQRAHVAERGVAPALEQPAIDQETTGLVPDEGARPRHFACGPVEVQLHSVASPRVCRWPPQAVFV